jgi:hypothetical protein
LVWAAGDHRRLDVAVVAQDAIEERPRLVEPVLKPTVWRRVLISVGGGSGVLRQRSLVRDSFRTMTVASKLLTEFVGTPVSLSFSALSGPMGTTGATRDRGNSDDNGLHGRPCIRRTLQSGGLAGDF